MTALLLVLLSIALVDSLSLLPMGLAVLSILLGRKRPFLLAAAFLAGIFVSYFAAGLLVLLGLEAVFEELGAYVVRVWKQPNSIEIVFGIVIGVLLLAIGARMARAGRNPQETEVSDTLSPWSIFLLAAGVNMVGLPGAFPYLGALDQVLRADLSTPTVVVALLFYNAAFILPLVAIVLGRAVLPAQSARLLAVMDRFFVDWGQPFIAALIILLGAVLVVDGVGLFFGQPLIPIP